MRQKLRQKAGRPSTSSTSEERCPVRIETISWVLNLAPVPADRGGQSSITCTFALGSLANHAGPDGRISFGGHTHPLHRAVTARPGNASSAGGTFVEGLIRSWRQRCAEGA